MLQMRTHHKASNEVPLSLLLDHHFWPLFVRRSVFVSAITFYRLSSAALFLQFSGMCNCNRIRWLEHQHRSLPCGIKSLACLAMGKVCLCEAEVWFHALLVTCHAGAEQLHRGTWNEFSQREPALQLISPREQIFQWGNLQDKLSCPEAP